MTGHADHRAVGEWTTVARARTAPDARLLYPATTPQVGARWRDAHAQVPMFYDDDLPAGTPLDELALHLELDDELADCKLVALRAQASQTMPLVAMLGETTWRRLWTTESFRSADATVVRRSWGMAGATA